VLSRIKSHRPGNKISRQNPAGVAFGKKRYNPQSAGAQNLADSDFFGPLFHTEGSQTKNSQACHKDSQQAERDQNSSWITNPAMSKQAASPTARPSILRLVIFL